MRTSKEWWDDTKQCEEKVIAWLQKQYTGEVTAAERILQLGEKFPVSTRTKKILEVIAHQEEMHAEWIKELLLARGVEPVIGDAETRYWKETLPGIEDFDTGSAVAAHAEKMRLARITAISEDEEAPGDIRETFKRILKDELFHERAFREMSTQQALDATLDNHKKGAEVLGLVE